MQKELEDRELLDRAARACGWIDYPNDSVEAGEYWHLDPDKAPFGRRLEKRHWCPLTDDGDAFRLAVAMCLPLDITDEATEITTLGVSCKHGSDPLAATRRAIVCAAAAIWMAQR